LQLCCHGDNNDVISLKSCTYTALLQMLNDTAFNQKNDAIIQKYVKRAETMQEIINAL